MPSDADVSKHVTAHGGVVQEVTRRVNLHGIWQAAYTAGVVLPKPVATAQYWHRSLNPKKLISVGFSRLAVRAPTIPDALTLLFMSNL